MNNLWQDIKTAPRDGTRILLSDGKDMYIATWDGFDWKLDATINHWDYFEFILHVSDWMPLPVIPGDEEENKCQHQ